MSNVVPHSKLHQQLEALSPDLSLKKETDFSKLGQIGYSELKAMLKAGITNPELKDLASTLIELLTLDKIEMSRMNRESRVIPNDDADKFIRIATTPGTHLIAIKAKERIGETVEDRIVGFGRLHLDKQRIPDLDEIPEQLKAKDICRVDRLFINDEGRQYFDGSNALDSILTKMNELAEGRTIVAKLLKGPQEIGKFWLKAQDALIHRGYDVTGDAVYETFVHWDGSTVEAKFAWATYPPESTPALANLIKRNEKLDAMHTWEQKRLSWVLPYIAPQEQQILAISGENDAHKIASMYPGNWVTALRPRENSRHQKLKNLRSLEAASLEKLADGWADVIYCSAAMPDLINSGRHGLKEQTVGVIASLVSKLKPGGIIVIRETVASGPNRLINLSLRTDDATDFTPSTARKFEEFLDLLETKNLLPESYLRKNGKYTADNHITYKVPSILKDEFLYLISYYKDWDWEVNRRYCGSTSEGRTNALKSHGLVEIISAWENNTWFRKTNWEGHLTLSEIDGSPVPYPKGNFVSIFRKPLQNEGVTIQPVRIEKRSNAKFLQSGVYMDVDGKLVEMVKRPHLTAGVVPVCMDSFLLLKGFPRPLVSVSDQSLTGAKISPYMDHEISQITGLDHDCTNEEILNSIRSILNDKANISNDEITRIDKNPVRYYPFLGTSEIEGRLPGPHLDEEVVSAFAKVSVNLDQRFPAASFSGFSTSGYIQAIERGQIHQASQVGSSREGRVERMAYEYAARNKLDLPKWMGERPQLPVRLEDAVKPEKMVDLLGIVHPGYLQRPDLKPTTPLIRSNFEEQDVNGRRLASATREYFTPENGANVVSMLPVRLVKNMAKPNGFDVLIGLEERRSPVVYTHTNGVSSHTLSIPTMYIQKNSPIQSQIAQALSETYRAETATLAPLGESYFPSPGILPFMVEPFISFVSSVGASNGKLHWVEIEDAFRNRDQIACGQARTSIFRTMHMLLGPEAFKNIE